MKADFVLEIKITTLKAKLIISGRRGGGGHDG